jgi:ABC-type amino acid transport substrate-binding protein
MIRVAMQALKILGLTICLFCFGATLAWATENNLPPDIAAIQKRGTLRVAVYGGDAPPLAMHDKNGHWSGIEVDFAGLIASQLGVKLVIVPADNYDQMVDLVASGKVDLGSELMILPKRALHVAFTHPYYSYHPHLLINRLQAAKYGWSNQAQVLQGLASGKYSIKLGVLANSASVQLMQQTFPQVTVVSYPDIYTALHDVTTGKIFAAMGTTPVEVQKFLQTDSHASLLAEDVLVPQAMVLVAVALPWQYFHLRELLNAYFDYLIANGVIEKLFQKYGETTV